MKPILLAIPFMFMAATTLPAFAHDDADSHAADHREHARTPEAPGDAHKQAPVLADDVVDSHAADHREHARTHEALDDAHEQAHDEGFSSSAEHRAYHRGLRDAHEEFHEDHPNTRHDH